MLDEIDKADPDLQRKRIFGDDHPDTLNSQSNLASDLTSLGHLEEALLLREDTVTRSRMVLGDEPPGHSAENGSPGSGIGPGGRSDEARALLEDVAARSRLVLGDDHPDTQSAVRALSSLNV